MSSSDFARGARSSCRPRLLPALAAGATLIAARPAMADPHPISPGLGATLSFGDGVMLGLGGDVRYAFLTSGRFDGCYGDLRRGVGPFAQAYWIVPNGGRFAAGLHGGGDVGSRSLALDADVGVAYRSSVGPARPGGLGLQVGGLAAFGSFFDFSLRGTLPFPGERHRPDVTLGLGLRFPGPFGKGEVFCPIEGRPLRVGGEQVLPDVLAAPCEARARAASASRLDPATRAAVASAFLEDARAEAASVPAFAALARDLVRAGAPASLVARALAAADEERKHAELCRHVASDLAGVELWPLELPPPPSPSCERRPELLLRLALEAWEDGCLGEGAAAARAARAARLATNDAVARVKRRIARDEAEHASLAWDVLSFCLAEGGASLVATVEEAGLGGPHEPAPRPDPEGEPSGARAHGLLTAHAGASAWEETALSARRRLSVLLATS